jgi:hypothetical protein
LLIFLFVGKLFTSSRTDYQQLDFTPSDPDIIIGSPISYYPAQMSIIAAALNQYGLKHLVARHRHHLAMAKKSLPDLSTPELFEPLYEILIRNRVGDRDSTPNPNLYEIYAQYRLLTLKDISDCRIGLTLNKEGYCTENVQLDVGSRSLRIYQIPEVIRQDEDKGDKFTLRGDFGEEYVAIHPCNNKGCIVCAYRGKDVENINRRFCKKLIIHDNRLVDICFHYPKCGQVSLEAYEL